MQSIIAHKDIFGAGKNEFAQRLAASQSTSDLWLLQAVAEGIWVWMTPSGNSCRRCELSRNVNLFWQCRTSWQASTRHARMLPRSTTQPFRPEPTLLDSSRLQRLWSPRACDLVNALYVIPPPLVFCCVAGQCKCTAKVLRLCIKCRVCIVEQVAYTMVEAFLYLQYFLLDDCVPPTIGILQVIVCRRHCLQFCLPILGSVYHDCLHIHILVMVPLSCTDTQLLHTAVLPIVYMQLNQSM